METEERDAGTPDATGTSGASDTSGRGPGSAVAWRSRPLADRHHLTALAIVLHGFRQALDPGSWYLKGSVALAAWIGPAARLPNDLDLVVPDDAGRRLLASGTLPPGPRGESLRLTRHEPVMFSAGAKPPVYRALVAVEGPESLPPVLLGLVLVPEADARGDERTTLLDFPGPTGAVTVPSVTGYRFLTQKLLRYARQRSGGRVNTHWWDLSDMLLAAAHPAFPALRLGELRRDLTVEVAGRGMVLPACLPAPPAEWLDFWDTATFTHGLPFGRLPAAAERLARFWEPVLRGPNTGADEGGGPVDPADAVRAPGAMWTPDAWDWVDP
ncbi:nucleotidyl transferase AbiEii/AbiGii toxin family protein [Streptomyces alboflavus]|uniref:nucleotidyl transferase AbiEii/AbiGii toxin family protein n=1 Tax=Streptomyces alboflavus TaxID=67267 RepID=UPI0036990936